MAQEMHSRGIKLRIGEQFKYVVTVVDRFTRWPDAIPIKDIETRKWTQIRISAHKFPIEQLRYTGTHVPRDQRICNFCKSNLIGDEFHYLFRCSNDLLTEIRQTFISDIQKVNSNFSKFDSENLYYYVLSLNDNSIMNCTANFVRNIYLKYKCLVNI